MTIYIYIYIYIFDILCMIPNIFYYICMTTPLSGSCSTVFKRRFIYNFVNVCPFDYTDFAVTGKLVIVLNGLSTPVGWVTIIELSVLNRFAIFVFSMVLVLFCFVLNFRSMYELLSYDLFRFLSFSHNIS